MIEQAINTYLLNAEKMTDVQTVSDKKWEFLSSLDIDIDFSNHISDIELITSYNDLRDEIEGSGALDVEILYYGSAMEFLTQNDSSLNESLGLAHDMGFGVDDLNSEKLASLLASSILQAEFINLEGEIEEFFTSLEQ